MLAELASAALLASTFTAYPAFGDRSIAPPPARHPRVEASVDKGLVIELIVRCHAGTAIVTYSKVERLYCGPTQGCARGLGTVLARVCR